MFGRKPKPEPRLLFQEILYTGVPLSRMDEVGAVVKFDGVQYWEWQVTVWRCSTTHYELVDAGFCLDQTEAMAQAKAVADPIRAQRPVFV